MELMHYVCLISVRDTMARLRWMLDELGDDPKLAVLDVSRLVERHIRLLLMGENFADTHIRTVLSQYLSQDIVDLIEDTIHDRLLFDVRRFMTLIMDEDTAIVDVACKWNGDLYVVVEEREVIRRMVDDYNASEYGRHQIEDESVVKMYCD